MNQFFFQFCMLVFWVSAGSVFAGENTAPIPDHIQAAVNDSTRPKADRARDPNRKPAEVLTFFEVKQGDTVADLMSGIGYYSEILTRAVGENGKLYAHNSPFVVNRFKERLGPGGLWEEKLASWKNAVQLVQNLENPGLPENSVDVAIMVLFYHDTYWQDVDRSAMNKAVYKAIKPGGVYGIIDHHAQSGSGDRDVQSLHRVDVELVKKELLEAGFVLEGESVLLRHEEDSRDYNVFRDFQTDRDKTDRFVLKFRKPK